MPFLRHALFLSFFLPCTFCTTPLSAQTAVSAVQTETDLANAEAALAAAKTNKILALKALQAAQDSSAEDAADAQLTAAKNAVTLSDAKKQIAADNQATLKSQFDVPAGSYSGAVTTSANAGVMEGNLLAVKALNLAAESIRMNLPSGPAGKSILLATFDTAPSTLLLDAYLTENKLAEQELSRADETLKKQSAQAQTTIEAARKALAAAAKAANEKAEAAKNELPNINFRLDTGLADLGKTAATSLSVPGMAIDAATKLLAFFKTDYSVSGTTVDKDDNLMLTALSNAITRKNNPYVKMYVPALYDNSQDGFRNETTEELQVVNKLYAALQTTMLSAQAMQSEMTGLLAESKLPATDKANLTTAAANLKFSVDSAKVILTLVDNYFAKLNATDDKAAMALSVIIRQKRMKALLKTGAQVLLVRMTYGGGSQYTRKNLWAGFGAMPYFHTGGVVVSYLLLDGMEGNILSSGSVPVRTPVVKYNRIGDYVHCDDPLNTGKKPCTKDEKEQAVKAQNP